MDGSDLMTPILELKNIDYSYHTLDGETKALSNISFSLTKGEFTAVVGPSGCGKSTLLKLLLGWLPDYSGAISIDETEIRNFTPEQLQRQMSYIPQNVFLFNTAGEVSSTCKNAHADPAAEGQEHDQNIRDKLGNHIHITHQPIGNGLRPLQPIRRLFQQFAGSVRLF